MSDDLLKPGQLIADRYRITSLLGSGGHAHVYLAEQEKLGRKVAVKVLKATIPQQGQLAQHKQQILIKRFEQEARLISQLRDPHTITMFDYGNTPNGLLYMVCEYIEGESMKELMIREGRLQPARVSSILEQLLMSLQEAHAYGVLHRDLKPDNIMLYTHLGRRDQVKLLDFGIAKIAEGDEEEHDLTAEGALVGTPRYIAPERIRGEPLKPASDLYSLGLVAYEALTGKRVLDGLHGVRALQAQLGDPSLRLPEDLNVPSGLKHVVERMVEKDMTIRYQVAEQVLRDIQKITQGEFVGIEDFDDEATRELDELLAKHHAKAKQAPPRPDHTHQLSAQRTTVQADHTMQTAQPKPSKHSEPSFAAPTSAPSAKQPRATASPKKPIHTSKVAMFAVIAGLIIAIIFAIATLAFLVVSK